MKKIISKILIILIIFLLLFDFVFASQYRCVYAAGGPGKGIVDGVTNLAGGIVSILYTLLKALIVGLTFGVQVLTTVTASVEGINTDSVGFWGAVADTIDPITPIDIFFNKYKLLDINYFDFEGLDENSYIYLFRLSVAEWYAIMKLIACAILLVILLYVGIRMALSTIADDKAKYKKMLADWVVSLVLIFVLQYIIIFTVYCNDAIVNALKIAFSNNEMSTLASEAIIKIGIQGIANAGIISFASVLVYVFIVFQTIIFLLAYMKRMVKVGFLIIISPLISITYSIDKMGDGKAQALGNWLKEFVYTILIQPFHCIMYLALVETAINLLDGGTSVSIFDIAIFNSSEYNQLAAGVLAIMCLKFINDGEQIVRKIFGFQDDGSTGMGAGAALGLAAIANAQKIGGATRKSVNNLKAKGAKFGEALKSDLAGDPSKLAAMRYKFANSKAGNLLGNAGKTIANSSAGKKVSETASKIANNTAVQTIGNKVQGAQKFVSDKSKIIADKRKENQQNKAEKVARKNEKKKAKDENRSKFGKAVRSATSNVGKYMKNKASLSTALGIMGAAMAYSSGNKGALEAIATGSAVQRGTQEFFGSSNSSIAKDDEDMHKASEDFAHKQQIDDKINENGTDFSNDAKKAIAAYETLKPLEEGLKERKENVEEKKNAVKKYEAKHPDVKEDEDPEYKRLKDELRAAETDKLDYEIEHEAEMEKARADISKYDADGNLEGYGAGDFAKWKDSAEEKFNSEIEMRFKARRNAPDAKKLDSVKDQIVADLRATMQANKKGQNQSTELTVDEEATISSTAQLLMDNIALGTLNKKGFGQEEQKRLITQQLGLNRDGANHLYNGVTNFSKATEQCADFSRQAQIAANHKHVRSYDETKTDIASDKLLKKELKRYMDSLSPREETKTTTSEVDN